MMKWFAEIYNWLKEMYWPIVTIRFLIVVVVFMFLLYVSFWVAAGLALVAFALAIAAYLFFFSFGFIFGVIAGSSNPLKPPLIIARRNRTVQFSILALWLWVTFEREPILSTNTHEIAGILASAALLFFLMYVSLLATDWMYMNDRIEGEKTEDLVFRRVLYIPAIVARDLLAPLILLIACLAITYDFAICTSALIVRTAGQGFFLALLSVIPEGSIVKSYLFEAIANFNDLVAQGMHEIRLSAPRFYAWMVGMAPECGRLD